MSNPVANRTAALWLLAAGVLLLSGASSALCAPAAVPELVGRVAIAMEPDVAAQLQLTEDQRFKLTVLCELRESAAIGLREKLKELSPAEAAAKLAEFRAESENKARAILTEQQWAMLERIRLARIGLAAMAEPSIAEQLVLSPQQQQQVAAVLKERQERLAGSEQPQVVRGETERKLAAILSPQQLRAWEAMVALESSAAAGKTAAGSSSPPVVQAVPPVLQPGQTAPATSPEAPSAESQPPVAKTDVAKPAPEQPATQPAATQPAPTQPAATQPTATQPAGTQQPVGQPGTPAAAPPAKDPEAEDAELQQMLEELAKDSTAPEEKLPAQPAAEQKPSAEKTPGPTPAPEEKPSPGKPPLAATPPATTTPSDKLLTEKVQKTEPGAAASPAASPTPAAKPEPPSPTDEKDIRLRFSFRFAPWKEVLEWFARNAGLSLVTDIVPPGTFNYTDSREYTPAEAIDVLNTILLTKGYTLIRRDKALMLVHLQDLQEGVTRNLVRVINPEELKSVGESELVSVLFQLDRLTPEEAETEVKKLLGPQGSIITLPRSRQIQVTETGSRLRAIQAVIKRIDEEPFGLSSGELRTFDVKHLTPEEALGVIKAFMDIPADRAGAPDNSIRFAADPAGKRILASGRPERLKRVEEILALVDVPKPGAQPTIEETPQLEVYPISDADPQSVLAVMQTLLAGLPDVRLTIDPKTGSLVALARKNEHMTIKATIEQLQRDSRKPEVIRLRKVDPEKAVLAINKLFGGGGDSKTPANPNAPVVDADPVARQLYIRGTNAQIEQIRNLLEKMGEDETAMAADTGSTVKMLPLKGRSAISALERMQEIWPAVRPNKIRVVAPASEIPSVRPSAAEEGGPAIREKGQRPSGDTEEVPNSGTSQPSRSPASMPTSPAARSSADKSAAVDSPVRFLLVSQPAGQHDSPSPGAEVPRAPLSRADVNGAGPLPEAPANSPGKPAEKQLPSAAGGPQKEPPPIIVVPGPNGLMIACEDPEALAEFERILNELTTGLAASGPEITIFYLKHAKAATVAETLEHIFGISSGGGGGPGMGPGGGGPGGLFGSIAGAALGDVGGGILGSLLGLGESGTIQPTGSIRITPDSRLNALVVQANPVDLDKIEQILKILDQKESPEEILVVPKAKMIALKNTQAEEVAQILKEVYQDRMVAAPGQAGRPPTPQEFMQLLGGGRGGRGGRGGAGGRTTEELQRMTVGVDTRTNSIILAAPEPLFTEVAQLIEQVDAAAGKSNQTMQLITLHSASSDTVQQALAAMVGDSVQFGRSYSRVPGGGRQQIAARRPGQTMMGGQTMPGMMGGTALPGMMGGRMGGMGTMGTMGGGGFRPTTGGFQPGSGFASPAPAQPQAPAVAPGQTMQPGFTPGMGMGTGGRTGGRTTGGRTTGGRTGGRTSGFPGGRG